MIFLFKDHTYDVIDPLIDEEKVPKKIEKIRDKLTAVLFECNTRLHSDTFVIVREDHLKLDFTPFYLTYSMSIVADDCPIDSVNTVTRTILVEDIISFYQTASLIYQLEYSNNAGDDISLGDTRVMLSALSFQEIQDDEPIVWDPDEESAKEFLNRQGLYCDTDIFLCGDNPQNRQKAVEDGCYLTRYGRHDDMMHLEYHFHEIRNILWLKKGRWFVFADFAIPKLNWHDLAHSDDVPSSLGIFGLCINHTSLVYLCEYRVFQNLREIDQCTLQVKRGSWGEVATDEDVRRKAYFTSETDENGVDMDRTMDAYNMPDMLYMATYLPQYWDLERFLTHVEPLLLEIEVLQHKRYYKAASYHVPVVKDGEGLSLDLFTIFAMILKMTPRKFDSASEKISYDVSIGGDVFGPES